MTTLTPASTLSADHIALQNHLNNIAAKQKESGSPFTIVTELSHWVNYDINSVAEFEHYDAQSTHYDFYKEVHGIRPRWFNYDKMTTEQIQEEIKFLESEYEHILLIDKQNKEAYSRLIQQRKARNAYKPNLVFSDLKELMRK